MWAFWSLIQSSTSAYATPTHPSWTTQPNGSTFTQPPLGYLEYAEGRLDLYLKIKSIWLKYNGSSDEDADRFPSPPHWQRFTSDNEWVEYIRTLEPMHEEIRQIQLESATRHENALKRYQQRQQPREED